MTGIACHAKERKQNFDIFSVFAHTKIMGTPILLIASYLALTALLSREKYVRYALIFSMGFCISSIEMLSGIYGLTVGYGLTVCLLSIPALKVCAREILTWVFITAALVFWLSASEFVDGYAFSYALLAAILAILCDVLFGKNNRQILCVSALLSAFAICGTFNRIFFPTDVAVAVAISVALTESFYTRANLSNSLDRLYHD